MKFTTTLNDAVVNVEYDELDASDSEGTVGQIEVTYNGQIVNDLVSQADYNAMLMEAEQHFATHCNAERFEAQMWIAECANVSIGASA